MSDALTKPCTAFAGDKLLACGPLAEVALAIRRSGATTDPVLLFDDATGRVFDIDLRGSDADILARLASASPVISRDHHAEAGEAVDATAESQEQKGRGRPKLGVIAREVTLLPRQWQWLAAQPGGASAALRRLVDDARKAIDPRQQRRAAQDAAYHFLQAIAGNLPGYEEAIRALYADDRPALQDRIAAWPADIQAYALRLAFGRVDHPADPPD